MRSLLTITVVILLMTRCESKAVGGATGGAVGYSTGIAGGWGTGLGGIPIGGVKGYTGGGGWSPFTGPVGGFIPFGFPIFGRK